MSTTLEKPADLNPYAAPVASSTLPQSQTLLPVRASMRTLRAVNRMAIVADLSCVAAWCCIFVGIYYPFGEVAGLSWIAYWCVFIVMWYTTAAGVFRSGAPFFALIPTAFLLPLPVIGTFTFLAAKQIMSRFMILNGFRPRLLGFGADDEQRQAMEQDDNYTPSLYFHRDQSKRGYIYSLGECWIITMFLGYLGFILFLRFTI